MKALLLGVGMAVLLSACGSAPRRDVVVVEQQPTCSTRGSASCSGCSVTCKKGERAICSEAQEGAGGCDQQASCMCTH